MEKIYSHYSNNRKKELIVHLRNVANKCKNILLSKDLDLKAITKEKLANISYLIGIVHDFGKSTTFFQNYLTRNIENNLSHHGLISALFGFLLVRKYANNDIWALLAYMVIKKHHGNIESPLEDIGYTFQDIKKQIENIQNNSFNTMNVIYQGLLEEFDLNFSDLFYELEQMSLMDPDDIIDKFDDIIFENGFSQGESIELFLITNLLYSILLDSDKKDAADIDNSYFNGATVSKIDVMSYMNNCRQKEPDKYSTAIPINKARNNFFQDVLNTPEIKTNNYLYSLTAPTGIGKTFTSYAFANMIKDFYLDGRKIIYCLPYTSIIDQNYSVIEDIIKYNLGNRYRNNPTKYLLRHHYLTPMKLLEDVNIDSDSKETSRLDKYLDDKLLLESWESGNIVTTFVQLLESIIGNKNSYLKKFHNIINSVIILDEVQNVPAEYYRILGEIFAVLAERFHTYILLLTATQPEIIRSNNLVSLINEMEYAKDEIFNRTEMEIVNELEEMNLDQFIDVFTSSFNSKSSLIVTNTISSALYLYQEISSRLSSYRVYSLTTYQIPLDRKEKISEIDKRIKDGENIIVISTQLIEAGVDLSFQEVYRDLGPLDSIIQVAGRCNRSGELLSRKGKVKIVHLRKDENSTPYSKKVYDNMLIDICKNVLLNKEYYNNEGVISANNYIDLSKEYFEKIRKHKQRESNQLLDAITNLDYSGITAGRIAIKDFKLVKDQAGKIDIIICKKHKDKNDNLVDVEERINTLKELYEEIKDNQGENNLNIIIGRIELIKKQLSQFRVSVYSNDLDKYNDYHIVNEFRFIKYVSEKDQKKYLYSEEIGFCKTPKEKPPSSIFT